jgi:hypothetical protein
VNWALTSEVDRLVDEWRTCADRYQRLDGRWPIVRLVMWPAAVVATGLLITGSSAMLPALMTGWTLVFAFGYMERLRAADVASSRAWEAIREYTGLSDAEVDLLVRDDVDENDAQATEARGLFPVPAGPVLGRYPAAGGAHVTITITDPDPKTGAPGWAATCDGCGWTDDQYACWHELWPAYPNIARGDVRGLLFDSAEEHAGTCQVPAGGTR